MIASRSLRAYQRTHVQYVSREYRSSSFMKSSG